MARCVPSPDDDRRYHLGLLPCAQRTPKYRRHWWRAGLAVVLLAGISVVVVEFGALKARVTCGVGLFSSSRVRASEGECVGIAGAGYDFGLSAYTSVLAVIDGLNQAADRGCNGAAPVTVGVLMPMASVNVGARGVHELEGFAAAQALANSPERCRRPVKLKVGNMGAREQAAVTVAQDMADAGDLVAVVGMGLSDRQSALAAVPFADKHIPMIADLITAEGFDRTGSAADNPDFTNCEDPEPYRSGVGRGYFYRVSKRDFVQVTALKAYTAAAALSVDMILTPTDVRDPTPCTGLALYHQAFGDVHDVRFTLDDPTTMALAVRQVCALPRAVTVVYAARGRDQSRFLVEIARQHEQGVCQARSVTVIEGSDGSRIRSPELDPDREKLRRAALTSASLRSGYLRLVYTPLADPTLMQARHPAAFTTLVDKMTKLGFDAADVEDGWAVNAHDALTTAAAAIGAIPLRTDDNAQLQVKPDQVATAIGGFVSRETAVPDVVQGPLYFDNSNNRVEGENDPVRVCPPADPAATTVRASTVLAGHRCPSDAPTLVSPR